MTNKKLEKNELQKKLFENFQKSLQKGNLEKSTKKKKIKPIEKKEGSEKIEHIQTMEECNDTIQKKKFQKKKKEFVRKLERISMKKFKKNPIPFL